MVDEYPRIQRIEALVTAINPGQCCIEPSNDTDLGYRMFCYKDLSETPIAYKLLSKGKPGLLLSLVLSGLAGSEIGIVRHTTTGLLIGGLMTVAQLNSYLSDGPIGGVTDHGALTGLSDDDHTQYILASGTRAFSGAQSHGDNHITNVKNVTNGSAPSSAGFYSNELAVNWSTGRNIQYVSINDDADTLTMIAPPGITSDLTLIVFETTNGTITASFLSTPGGTPPAGSVLWDNDLPSSITDTTSDRWIVFKFVWDGTYYYGSAKIYGPYGV
jgi:hypothetical protein